MSEWDDLKINESTQCRHNSISPITEIIADIKNGKMVILVDDENRENEGDFVLPPNLQQLNTLILWLNMVVA